MAMDVQLHSFAFFLPCIVLAISFFSAESHSHGKATTFSECNHTYNCGKISNIAYPFWGQNRLHYCGGGDPFRLTCQTNNTTMITVGQQNFTVVSINPQFYSMKLIQTALSVACPWYFTTTSLDPAVFSFDNLTIQNLTVFYKCPTRVSSSSNITCNSGVAFFAKQDGAKKFSECKAHDQILVQVGIFDKDGLNTSLRNGFVVQYVANWDSCSACNSSGGICGTDIQHASRFACHCRNGVRPYSCPKGMNSSFFSLVIIPTIFSQYQMRNSGMVLTFNE